MFKNGKTAIRGGFGQFFLRERTSPVFAALTQNPPFVRSVSGERTLDAPVVFVGLPASAGAGSPRFSFDPEAATPYSWQFNILVDQELWKDTVLEVGYVGNRCARSADQLRYQCGPAAKSCCRSVCRRCKRSEPAEAVQELRIDL